MSALMRRASVRPRRWTLHKHLFSTKEEEDRRPATQGFDVAREKKGELRERWALKVFPPALPSPYLTFSGLRWNAKKVV